MSKTKHSAADVSILLTISHTIRTFTFLLISVITVRILSKESYAIYLQIMFLLHVIINVLTFGMPRSIYYFLPRVKNKKKFVLHTFVILNTLGLIALTIIILGRGFISDILNNRNLITGLCFLAFYIFFATNKIIYGSILLSTNNGKILSITEIALSLLFFICIMVPLFLKMGLNGIFWGVLLYYVIEFSLTAIFSLKNTDGDYSDITHAECLTEQFKYILPLGLISIVSIFSSSIDRIIISFFMGTENFALYDRGAMTIPIISGLSITVGAVIMPRLVEYYKNNDIKGFLTVWHASIEKVALIIFPCFIFLFIHAGQLITLLYTDRFSESIIIFRIYLFILLFTITIYGNIFNAANRNKYLLYISIGGVILNSLLCVVMLQLYGRIGPAISTVTMHTIVSLTNIILIGHILQVKFSDIFPWVFLSKLMLCAFASGIIPLLIKSSFDLPKILLLSICAPIYFIVYYVITNYFSLLKESDKQIFYKWTGINWLRKQNIVIPNQTKP